MNNNEKFLNACRPEVKTVILGSIATHYGLTPDIVEREVIAPDAHDLLEYTVEPYRQEILFLMKKMGFKD